MNLLVRPQAFSYPLRNPFNNVSKPFVRYVASAGDVGIDPKREIIRRTLYPPNVRNRATPTGSWRPDTMRALKKAIPSIQAHDTIERAFKLYIRHKRQRRQAELERKYECMRRAMIELEKIDPRLAFEANKVEDPRVRTEAESALLKSTREVERRASDSRIHGLFPRELRAPTDTPPKDGWSYGWTPPSVRIT